MAWEQRRRGWYYYQSVREGDRVRKVYFGRKDLAGLLGLEAAQRQGRELAHQRQVGALRRSLSAAIAQANELDHMADLLLKAVFLMAGYRRFNYTWFKPSKVAGRRRLPRQVSNCIPELPDSTIDCDSSDRAESDVPKSFDAPALQRLIREAESGRQVPMHRLQKWLAGRPEVWFAAYDLSERALESWLKLNCGRDLLVHESARVLLNGLQQDLLGPAPSLLHRLCGRRLLVAWLTLQVADRLACEHVSGSPTLMRFASGLQRQAYHRWQCAAWAMVLVREIPQVGAGGSAAPRKSLARQSAVRVAG